jgi:hypothetical protein
MAMHNKLKTSDILANSILHTASSSDNIAVIEALASVVVNNAKLMTSSDKSMDLQQSIIKISSLYKDAEKQLEDEKKLQVCKRVARRALSEK